MTDIIHEIYFIIDAIVDVQQYATAQLHISNNNLMFDSPIVNVAYENHLRNFELWHEEDKARRKDVSTEFIAQCKRNIDQLNQKRTNAYEKLDQLIVAMLVPLIPEQHSDIQNTESVGMALDRLSIMSLKIYHMQEHLKRQDLDIGKKEQVEKNLQVMKNQKNELVKSLKYLIEEYIKGVKVPKQFCQFKMYNDPLLNPEIYKRHNDSKLYDYNSE